MLLSAQTVTLIAALLAAATSIVSLLINSRLTFNRERRQVLLRKEIDRLFAAEEAAGRVVEIAGSYQPVSQKLEVLPSLFVDLDDHAGRLARYPKVRQGIRDLSQTCKNLLASQQQLEDDRAIRKEVGPAHEVLIAAIDKVVGRQKRFNASAI